MTYFIIIKFPKNFKGEVQRIWVTPDEKAANNFVTYMLSQQDEYDYDIQACPALPSMNNKSI